MRVTTKSRYGTRLLLDIATYGKKKPVPLSDVSTRQKISLKYLEQITSKLKKAGILESYRGQLGGHRLAKSPDKISIGQIVRILEESMVIIDCAEKGRQVCGACNGAGECLSRWVWVEAGRAMFDRLDEITIASLLAIGKENLRKE
ncbi:MAG: Rrf2 family transcriptional regulator [Desulfobacula sp.]|jgi:Rrf2 family protein|uniref:RrF2 family transcriptional regulator n=1 Tax=Desulfobacula sp. TaxID=2593537 RepID=UPI001DE49284|nr:Rrf2 family transcriptional regulator [Desulfobacula sp.]MBT3486860.1 Rrf2 family transcriptional regulator [Desulfobacula sp.]MBT3805986.1 Rrf2 family transcriptional regulator [Desulfobacula sp.]MBT4026893.1 Rrf2 family transcriptional regulator [Desulfobacula sp.]MBT4200796.1 Rrf2 family transcriptional regulator [Desulfobacula sp.]